MKRIVRLTESDIHRIVANSVGRIIRENKLNIFSLDVLKTTKWESGYEIMEYCKKCNLILLGEGLDRRVYQIDDEHVIKIEKNVRNDGNQNTRELEAFKDCDEQMKQFIPNIYDWDKSTSNPLWIICEQVIPATYVDFQKILGIDFGSYTSSADLARLKQDMNDYSKYPGKTVNKYSFNLMNFLEAYEEGDTSDYSLYIQKSRWLQELLHLLDYGIVNSWELQNIENWGLVNRNGQTKLIIIDIGI